MNALTATQANAKAMSAKSLNARVGMIAGYSTQMQAAIAMPANTPQQIAARNEAITAARAVTLSNAANRAVTPQMVEQVDALLGLPRTNPKLGAIP
jgi:hypothetical protein